MKKLKKTSSFNDLLLPLIMVMAILPFIVYLAMYNCGLSSELWYGDNDIIGDIYCYYKSRVFILISMICAFILLLRILVYKGFQKPWKPLLLLGGYVVLAVVSTIFSLNYQDSLVGSLYHFESIFALVGYVIILIYAYVFVNTKEDILLLDKFFTGAVVLLVILGVLQAMNMDIFDAEAFIRLISPKEWEKYALTNMQDAFIGNNVSLTLYNPNNAGQYLAMVLPFFVYKTIYQENKRKRVLFGILSVVLLILVWFTYSRGALLAVVIEFIIGSTLFLWKNIQKTKVFMKKAGLFLCGCVIILLIADGTQNFKFLSRFFDERSYSKLEQILTEQDCIQIAYDGHKLKTGFSSDDSGIFLQLEEQDITSYYDSTEGQVLYPDLENIQILPMELNEGKTLFIMIEGKSFSFLYEDGQYWFSNDLGKPDKLTAIEAIDFHGLESKGSGRLYIWSRTLPLLKQYFFIGSGPDTFYRAFPQNDYVGKEIYAGTSARLIEKAHNGYLMTAVQTGVVSLILLLVFYGWYVKTFIRHIKQNRITSLKDILGISFFIGTIGYMFSSLFYDSSLQCTPLFCIFLGISMSIMLSDTTVES
ncbi:MAG: O-antigen ligase family protein [Lachnospiraceae bacterium]|nr:O-antigen ligase family protein [Lachnospiraceae bacterium]